MLKSEVTEEEYKVDPVCTGLNFISEDDHYTLRFYFADDTHVDKFYYCGSAADIIDARIWASKIFDDDGDLCHHCTGQELIQS